MKCRYCGREVEEGKDACLFCGSITDLTAWIPLKNEKERLFWASFQQFLFDNATNPFGLAEKLPAFLDEHREEYSGSRRMLRDFDQSKKLCELIIEYKNANTFTRPGGGFPDIHNNNKDFRDLYRILLDVSESFSYPEADHMLSLKLYRKLVLAYNVYNSEVLIYEDIVNQYKEKIMQIISSSIDSTTFLSFKNNTSFSYTISVMARKTIPGGWFSKPMTIPSYEKYDVTPYGEFRINATVPTRNAPYEMYWHVEKVNADERFDMKRVEE